MGIVTVRTYAKDTTLAAAPIAGVLIRVFDEPGTTFILSGTTNALGLFQFDVNGSVPPVRYQLRPSKTGVSFNNPELIDVYDPAVPANNFEIYGNIHELQPAIGGPRMCRVQGFLYDIGGRPLPNSMVRFQNRFQPVVVDGISVLGNVEALTDAAGWVAVELFRLGEYAVSTSGMHENSFDIVIPDRDSVLLADILFPVVASVTFNPAPPWNVPLGGALEVVPTVVTSGYVTLDGAAPEDVVYESADDSVATVVADSEKLTIQGVRLGSTTLDLSRADETIVRVPDTPITGTGGVINVV